VAVEDEGITGSRMGVGVRRTSGAAAGRQLYPMYSAKDLLLCGGRGDSSNLRFRDVLAGDEVRLDNRAFLAYCYYYRHHVQDFDEWQFLRLDGKDIYPQHDLPTMSPFMGVPYSGQYEGKLMWVHHTHDASLWPPQGIGYRNAVDRVQGEEGLSKKFRLRWTENAEHVPAEFVPPMPNRATNTWLIDYRPVIEQCLVDLASWVEDGIEPEGSNYTYNDGSITLPASAAERGGIQPVVTATANGASKAEVRVGEPVELEVRSEVPPKAGTIIGAKWDFDGSGTYPFVHSEIDGTSTEIKLSTTYTWDKPGTYFATVMVESNREGDVNATARRLPNVASARIVVS
ncbi:MAG: hypothetical protein JWL70_1541, partial [Acidimicrobiia bacterium]|nr:hypothetical protein [Acidimicrobiia bacterium]